MEHMLHDPEVVVHYEIMDFFGTRIGIQAYRYRPCKNGQCPDVSLEIKFYSLLGSLLTGTVVDEWQLRIQNHTLRRPCDADNRPRSHALKPLVSSRDRNDGLQVTT